MKINHEKLVRTWRQANREGRDIPWVADQLGYKMSIMYSSVRYLREKGVILPQLVRAPGSGRGAAIDVEKLM